MKSVIITKLVYRFLIIYDLFWNTINKKRLRGLFTENVDETFKDKQDQLLVFISNFNQDMSFTKCTQVKKKICQTCVW